MTKLKKISDIQYIILILYSLYIYAYQRARIIEDLQYQQEWDAMRIGNLCNPATPTISSAALVIEDL